MRIGIIGAMPPEVKTILSYVREPKKTVICGIEYVEGKLGQLDAVVARGGVGKVCAAVCAQLMITNFGVEALINTGVAGGLAPDLGVLDIALATGVVQHDIDTTAVGDPLAFVSELKEVEMKADEDLSEKIASVARDRGLRVTRGVIASGDQFVTDAERKRFLREEFGAIACEMESGAMAQVCRMNGIPFCVLRAISDGANEQSGMDYATFVPLAAEEVAGVVLSFCGVTC